jgi:hypothetical protein
LLYRLKDSCIVTLLNYRFALKVERQLYYFSFAL